MTDSGKPEPPVERVLEDIKEARLELAEAREEERRAEHKLEDATEELGKIEHRHHEYPLIVNRKPYVWHHEQIDGAQIKELAGSPRDWVVNQNIDGPGEDPEIADKQRVNLAFDAEPKGEKRFTTRKPKTAPGA